MEQQIQQHLVQRHTTPLHYFRIILSARAGSGVPIENRYMNEHYEVTSLISLLDESVGWFYYAWNHHKTEDGDTTIRWVRLGKFPEDFE